MLTYNYIFFSLQPQLFINSLYLEWDYLVPGLRDFKVIRKVFVLKVNLSASHFKFSLRFLNSIEKVCDSHIFGHGMKTAGTIVCG